MITGLVSIDMILSGLVIALVVASVGAAFWPPHRHQFVHLKAERWEQGFHYQLRQCACGKTKDIFTPTEDSTNGTA